jgi:hypothetical protein
MIESEAQREKLKKEKTEDFAPAVYSIDKASAEAAFAPIVLAFANDPAHPLVLAPCR